MWNKITDPFLNLNGEDVIKRAPDGGVIFLFQRQQQTNQNL